jgi:hypothetical protein
MLIHSVKASANAVGMRIAGVAAGTLVLLRPCSPSCGPR